MRQINRVMAVSARDAVILDDHRDSVTPEGIEVVVQLADYAPGEYDEPRRTYEDEVIFYPPTQFGSTKVRRRLTQLGYDVSIDAVVDINRNPLAITLPIPTEEKDIPARIREITESPGTERAVTLLGSASINIALTELYTPAGRAHSNRGIFIARVMKAVFDAMDLEKDENYDRFHPFI